MRRVLRPSAPLPRLSFSLAGNQAAARARALSLAAGHSKAERERLGDEDTRHVEREEDATSPGEAQGKIITGI